MLYLETSPNTFSEWTGQPISGVLHPRNIEQLWSAADLAKVGLYAPSTPAVPEGKIVTGQTVQRVNGAVTWVYTLDDAPPPSTDDLHPPLDPWRFWAVVELSGITEAGLYAAIDAQPEASFRAIARAKLRNPPGGKYYRSDALFADAGLLTALNLTAATVDTLWSQAHALPA